MPYSNAAWEERVDRGPVLVGSGRVTGPEDVAAATGRTIKVYVPRDAAYNLLTTINAPTEILSLTVGLHNATNDLIIAGTGDQILTWSGRQGAIVPFGQTPPEPQARFVSLATGNLENSGGRNLIAAAAGKEALYVYQAAKAGLDLVDIRLVPGTPEKVAVVERPPGTRPLVAVAVQTRHRWSILTLTLTERGFEPGPALEGLPAALTALTAGDLTAAAGKELAWGGNDGHVRIVEAGETLKTVLATVNLGSSVSALAAGKWAAGSALAAGTPEGYIFIYSTPVTSARPQHVQYAGAGVHSLAFTPGGRLIAGTVDGRVQAFTGTSFVSHRVRPGETLWLLAREYNTTVSAIAAANGLNVSGAIYPGQMLKIPKR